MTHNQTPAGSVAKTCPRCGSKDPALHPAMQFEGEVQECAHPFHAEARRPPLKPEAVSPEDWDKLLDELERRQRERARQRCNGPNETPPPASRQQPDVAGKDKLTADDPQGLYQCKAVRNGMRAFAEWDGHKLWMLAFEGKVLSGDEYTDFIGPLVPATPPIAADDRAELERRELQAIKKLNDVYEEFDTVFDPECKLPPLASRTYDNFVELMNRIDALKEQVRLRDGRTLQSANTALRQQLAAYRTRFGCLSCGEDHPPEVMCPPHEVRTTGQHSFRETVAKFAKEITAIRQQLATAEQRVKLTNKALCDHSELVDDWQTRCENAEQRIAALEAENKQINDINGILDGELTDASAAADAIGEYFDEAGNLRGDGRWRVREIEKHARTIRECFSRLARDIAALTPQEPAQ